MQLSVERALDRLAERPADPAYFLYGEEPLQLSELGDAIRRRCQADGVVERLVFDIESTADWDRVNSESSAMSLFAERRLIEIRLASRKPDKRASAILEAMLANPTAEDIVLITAAKLDGRARSTAWFKLLEKHAVSVQVRDLAATQLPAWLNRRTAKFDKRLTTAAVELIADRVEGNLLAAAQEVEKLCLVVDGEEIDEAAVLAAVTDSTRFDVYQFVDAVLERNLARAMRIARGLREEGTEPVLLVWALGREFRALASMAAACAKGQATGVVMDQHRVWSNRKQVIGAVLERYRAGQLLSLLVAINHLDTIVKGGREGSPWDEIELIALRFCGHPTAANMQAVNQ